MGLMEMECESVDGIQLDEDKVQQQALVNTEIDLRGSRKEFI